MTGALLIAARLAPMSTGAGVGVVVFGLATLPVGVLWYHDPYRHWQGPLPRLSRSTPFSMAWYSAGAILIGMGSLLYRLSSVVGWIFIVPGLPLVAIGVIGMVWLPRRLLPACLAQQRASRSS